MGDRHLGHRHWCHVLLRHVLHHLEQPHDVRFRSGWWYPWSQVFPQGRPEAQVARARRSVLSTHLLSHSPLTTVTHVSQYGWPVHSASVSVSPVSAVLWPSPPQHPSPQSDCISPTVRPTSSSSLLLGVMCLLHDSDTHCPPCDLRPQIRARAFPPRRVLVPRRHHRRAMDRLHLHRLHPAEREPRQLADAKLCNRRGRHRAHVLHGILGP